MTRLFSFTLPVAALAAAIGGGMIIAYQFKPELVRAAVPQVRLALSKPGPSNQLQVGASGLAAGDRVERPFELQNAGAGRITYTALTTTAPRSSLLDRDRMHGLHLRIDKCTKPWLKRPGRLHALRCPGTVWVVVPRRPFIGSGIRLRNVPELVKSGRKVHLRLILNLPASAPATLAGARSTLRYVFTAVAAAR